MSKADKLTAEDITSREFADKIIHVWAGDRRNSKYKVYPCRKGKSCDTSRYCPYSHTAYGGIPIIRCLNCVKGLCDGKQSIQKSLNMSGGTGIVYQICLELADFMQNNLERIVTANQIPEVKPVPTEAAEQGELKIDAEPLAKKRAVAERSFYFIMNDESRAALVNMVGHPKFRGIVKVGASHLGDLLDVIHPQDILALASQIEELPGSRAIIKCAQVTLENLQMKQQLAIYADPRKRPRE